MEVQQLINVDDQPAGSGVILNQPVDVIYAPGYRVDQWGNVWTCWKRGRYPVQTEVWTELLPSRNQAGYCYANLRIVLEKRVLRVPVHHLVLEHFVGSRPEGLEGCHKDNVKWHNWVDNLFWGTHKENAEQAASDGLLHGRNVSPTKVTPFLEALIKALFYEGWSGPDIAEKAGVGRTLVYKVIHRNGWKRNYNVHRSKISERVFDLIWDSLGAGIPHNMIAEDHGFSRGMIGQIANGWKPTVFALDSDHFEVALDLRSG